MKIILISLFIFLSACSKNPQEAKADSRQKIFALSQEINSLKRKQNLSATEKETVEALQKKLQEEISIYNKKHSRVKEN